MDRNETMQKYAELAVRTGANVQPGQVVLVQCTVENAEFCRMVVAEAYRAGAREVIVRWKDDAIGRLHYENMSVESFEQTPAWQMEMFNHVAREQGALISIISSDPEALKGVEPAKLIAASKRSNALTKEYESAIDRGELAWNIVAVPGKAWAKKVFPDVSEAEAVERLWAAIFQTVRMNEADPVAAWRAHSAALRKRADWLNQKRFAKLHYTNSIGTDFTVGLVEDHIWTGGGDRTVQGIDYFANMPTEEVFTMPHADRADGVVYSAMPLSYQGNLITDFRLTFREGRVVDWSAREGGDALRALLDTDEGSLHLGEVALVPYDSPISNSGILFYNTLFDENASCHLALGTCYPDTLRGGTALSKEELRQRGGNDSINHVDFMIGTADLRITGVDGDGVETVIFENGNWVI